MGGGQGKLGENQEGARQGDPHRVPSMPARAFWAFNVGDLKFHLYGCGGVVVWNLLGCEVAYLGK